MSLRALASSAVEHRRMVLEARDAMIRLGLAMNSVRGDNVGFNRPDILAGATYQRVFTREDQSVGLNAIELLAAQAYQAIFSSTPGLRLPGYTTGR